MVCLCEADDQLGSRREAMNQRTIEMEHIVAQDGVGDRSGGWITQVDLEQPSLEITILLLIGF